MEWKILIFIALPSWGYCAVTYIPQSQNPLNMVKEKTNVTISCYYNGTKPPGQVTWTLNDQEMAFDCHVDTAGKGILTPTDDCFADTGNGIANYSFVINEALLDRDQNSWMCQNLDRDEPLNIPIAVVGAGKSYTEDKKTEYKSGDNLAISAVIGCTYPPGEVLWCLNNGTDVICSDQTDWSIGLFEINPTIHQITENCTNYKTPDVLKYVSRIEGKIASAASSTKYQLYYRINGIDYKTDVAILLEDQCLNRLLAATITSLTVNIVILVASIFLLQEYQIKRLRNNSANPLHLCLIVLWILDIIFFVVCGTLNILLLSLCKDWIGVTFGLFGVIVLLFIVHLIQIGIGKLVMRKLFYTPVQKDPNLQEKDVF